MLKLEHQEIQQHPKVEYHAPTPQGHYCVRTPQIGLVNDVPFIGQLEIAKLGNQ